MSVLGRTSDSERRLEASTAVTGSDLSPAGSGRARGVRGRSGLAWLRSPRLAVGVGLLAVFVLGGIIGPIFLHHPNAFVGPPLAPPSGRFLLGTTQTGQDVLAQLVVSTGGSLEVGFLAGGIATAVSILIGIGGGFVGGRLDELLALLTNVVLVIPALPLIIIIAAYVHGGGESTIILVIAFTSWAAAARVLRAQTLSVRTRDYVLASRVAGERSWRIVLVEILPNELAVVVSQFIFTVIFAVLTQAGLAFLGLASTNTLTWGTMLYYAQNDQALSGGAWWWFVPPGLCIALLGTSLALVNFGLDEILNPRLRIGGVRPGRRQRDGRGR